MIKPDVVLYEEGLDQDVIRQSVYAIANADTLIIGGTSLAVYPAASFIDYFRGRHLVVINKGATARRSRGGACDRGADRRSAGGGINGDVHFLQKCTSPFAFAGVPICVLPCPHLHLSLSPMEVSVTLSRRKAEGVLY